MLFIFFFSFFIDMMNYRNFNIWSVLVIFFFFSSRRRHTRSKRDWSSDVCSSDLDDTAAQAVHDQGLLRFRDAQFPRKTGVFDAGQRACAGASAISRDQNVVGLEIGRASCRERV